MDQLTTPQALGMAAALLILTSMAVLFFHSPEKAPIEQAQALFAGDLRFGLASEPEPAAMRCIWEENPPQFSDTRMVVCDYYHENQSPISVEYHFNENDDFVYSSLISPHNAEAD